MGSGHGSFLRVDILLHVSFLGLLCLCINSIGTSTGNHLHVHTCVLFLFSFFLNAYNRDGRRGFPVLLEQRRLQERVNELRSEMTAFHITTPEYQSIKAKLRLNSCGFTFEGFPFWAKTCLKNPWSLADNRFLNPNVVDFCSSFCAESSIVLTNLIKS